MNKKQVLAELIKNLEEYSERGYVFHPKFMYEFQVLIKNATGNEKEIFTCQPLYSADGIIADIYISILAGAYQFF